MTGELKSTTTDVRAAVCEDTDYEYRYQLALSEIERCKDDAENAKAFIKRVNLANLDKERLRKEEAAKTSEYWWAEHGKIERRMVLERKRRALAETEAMCHEAKIRVPLPGCTFTRQKF